MTIKQVTLSKQFKIGLPNYSNITIGVDMTWDVGENEQFDFSRGWDIINHELNNQSDTDPSWIKTKEYKNKYKATIDIKK